MADVVAFNREHADTELQWFGQERTEDEFRRLMIDEGRLLYEFDVTRTYGLF